MKVIVIISKVFLVIISLFYFVSGILSIVGVMFGIKGAINGVHLFSYLFIIAPQQILPARLGGWFGGELKPPFSYFYYLIGIFYIIYSLIGMFGCYSVYKNRKIGYRIWFFLIILSVGVSLWNILWNFLNGSKFGYTFDYMISPSYPNFVWLVLSIVAYSILRKSYQFVSQIK